MLPQFYTLSHPAPLYTSARSLRTHIQTCTYKYTENFVYAFRTFTLTYTYVNSGTDKIKGRLMEENWWYQKRKYTELGSLWYEDMSIFWPFFGLMK